MWTMELIKETHIVSGIFTLVPPRHVLCPSLSPICSGIDIPRDKPWVVSEDLLEKEEMMC